MVNDRTRQKSKKGFETEEKNGIGVELFQPKSFVSVHMMLTASVLCTNNGRLKFVCLFDAKQTFTNAKIHIAYHAKTFSPKNGKYRIEGNRIDIDDGF